MGNSKAGEMLIWELEEYNQFMKYAIQYPDLYYPVMLMYWSGIRLGELMALKISSLDFESSTIFIKQTYYRKRREDKFTTTKTDNSYRIVRLPQFVIEELQEYVNSLYGRLPDDKLFYRSKGFYEKKLPTVVDRLPEDRMKTVGTSTDYIEKGEFRSKEEGIFKEFVIFSYDVYLKITTNDTIYYVNGNTAEETYEVYEFIK